MDNNIRPLTKDDFLSIFRQATDSTLFDAIMSSDDDGKFILEMMAEALEEQASQAFDMYRKSNPSFATFGSKSTVGITFTRTDDSAEESISGGTVLKTQWGLKYILTEGVVFAIGETEANGVAQSVWADDDYNVSPGTITVIEGISSDRGITCTNEEDAYGGNKPLLDILAANKSIYREEGESEQSLRVRLRGSPDVVTVAAIKRCISRHMYSAGTGYTAFYTKGADAGFFADADPADAGVETDSPWYRKFRKMALSRRDTHRSFFVIVPRLRLERFHGIIADGGKLDKHSACDLSDDYGFSDGVNLLEKSTYSALMKDLQRKRGAGIRASLIAEWAL